MNKDSKSGKRNEYIAPEKIIGIYPSCEDGEEIIYKGVQAIKEGNDFYINSSFDTNSSNLEDFLEFNNADHVVGVMPSQYVFQRRLTLPPVEPKRLPEIIRFEAIQQIPFDIKDVSWNYKILKDSSNSSFNLVLSSARKDHIKKYFPYEKIDIIEAANNALPLLYKKDSIFQQIQNKRTWGILDINKEDTLLLICENGAVSWSRHMLVGSKNNKIRENEDSDLISEIKRSIGFYSSGNPDSKIVHLISPNFPELTKGLLDQISGVTGICTEYQPPYERFAGNFKLSNEYIYPAAGVLASEDPVNLFSDEKSSRVRNIAGSLLKKISEPIAGIGRGIERLGNSVNSKGERIQFPQSRHLRLRR